jgi:hypothetical protein
LTSIGRTGTRRQVLGDLPGADAEVGEPEDRVDVPVVDQPECLARADTGSRPGGHVRIMSQRVWSGGGSRLRAVGFRRVRLPGRQMFVYRVDPGGGDRDVVTMLESDWVFQHGLHPEAIVGVLREGADPDTSGRTSRF